jgi:hypothetical protein
MKERDEKLYMRRQTKKTVKNETARPYVRMKFFISKMGVKGGGDEE